MVAVADLFLWVGGGKGRAAGRPGWDVGGWEDERVSFASGTLARWGIFRVRVRKTWLWLVQWGVGGVVWFGRGLSSITLPQYRQSWTGCDLAALGSALRPSVSTGVLVVVVAEPGVAGAGSESSVAELSTGR